MTVRSTRGVARWLFHRITVKDYVWPPPVVGRDPEADLASARRYLARFRGSLDVAGKTALDVGCGNGQLCLELARLGAERVVGADIQELAPARESLVAEPG